MRRLLTFCLLTIIFLVICKNSFPNNNDDSNVDIELIKEHVNKLMEKANIPGLSLIIQTEVSSYNLNFGFADLDSEEKVTSQTLFEIGSCSKAFTALAILKLEKEKKINIDSKLTKYLPWMKFYYNDSPEDISIRQLLQHTSGITWYTWSLIP